MGATRENPFATSYGEFPHTWRAVPPNGNLFLNKSRPWRIETREFKTLPW